MAKWDAGEPRRDDVRSTLPETGKHRSTKNTRRWCRGKVNVEHVTEVRVSRNVEHITDVNGIACYRAEWWPKHRARHWSCAHERYCVNCGKILQYTLGVDCPIYEPEKITRFRGVRLRDPRGRR